jgi:hypothetical protein
LPPAIRRAVILHRGGRSACSRTSFSTSPPP